MEDPWAMPHKRIRPGNLLNVLRRTGLQEIFAEDMSQEARRNPLRASCACASYIAQCSQSLRQLVVGPSISPIIGALLDCAPTSLHCAVLRGGVQREDGLVEP